jgi:hypothetical protein
VDSTITGMTEPHLLLELERVEEAIARSITFTRRTAADGRSPPQVDKDLLALAEREHAIVSELRQRRRAASPARPAAAVSS